MKSEDICHIKKQTLTLTLTLTEGEAEKYHGRWCVHSAAFHWTSSSSAVGIGRAMDVQVLANYEEIAGGPGVLVHILAQLLASHH